MDCDIDHNNRSVTAACVVDPVACECREDGNADLDNDWTYRHAGFIDEGWNQREYEGNICSTCCVSLLAIRLR